MLRARCYHLAPVTAHCTPGLLVAIRVPSSVSVGILPCRNFSLNPGLSATFPQSPTKGQTKLATRDPSNKKWADLSAAQKVGRTASTGASLATIIAGVLVTAGVFTFVYLDIVAPNSTTSWFNNATERVKSDTRCRKLLGNGKIKAYGEPTSNRWARNRPLALAGRASVKKDRDGTDHILMHFNVEGDLDKGVVRLHLIRRPGQDEYSYHYLFLDVAGKTRVELENAARSGGRGKSKAGFLGVRWR